MKKKGNAFIQLTKIMFISMLVVSVMTGCGKKATTDQQEETGQQTNTEQQGETAQQSDVKQQETAGQQGAVNQQEENAETVSAGDIDVDLTQMSSTMIYSEVYNMVSTPEDYIGKTVKMRFFRIW